jgi:L-cystine transport system ATP-binding protein
MLGDNVTVKVAHLHKYFGKNHVLSDVNLEVHKGDVLVVMGPSGSGKTTLLRCINYLERPNSGEISIGGFSIQSKHASKKDILALRRRTAMVFQNFNLFKNQTILENVMEGLITAQKVPKDIAREKSMKQLEKVGLADKINAYPSQISGGQQQRAGIARALALNPDVILFDEPTSALDPELVGEVLSIIREVAGEGITMIVATHEMSFARDVANRVVFICDGVIVEEGSPDDIFLHAREERTRQFLKRIVQEWSYNI